MQIISVNMYGGKSLFSGREQALNVDIISCDHYEQCSYYKNKQCLRVRKFLQIRCKFGKTEYRKGWTSKAQKYRQFKNEWQSHEQYEKKLSTVTEKLGKIGDYVIVPYHFIELSQNDDGSITIHSPYEAKNKVYFIEEQYFTIDFIKNLLDFTPGSLFGGQIKQYQNETVPMIISHIKELFPDKYAELINKNPDVEEKINYVGRKALLKTINKSYVHFKSSHYPNLNETWLWNGDLVYVDGWVNKFRVTEDYVIDVIRLKPGETASVIISDNAQVNDDTVFLD